jgi:hypothetical protein
MQVVELLVWFYLDIKKRTMDSMKKNIHRVAFAFGCFCLSLFWPCFAQGVGINPSGTPPHPSAILDLQSSQQGFLPPRLTTAERNSISSPATGLMIYNISTNCLEIYISSIWQSIFCGCSGAPVNLTYSNNQATYCQNVSIVSNQPSTQGSVPSVYSVSPALPQGLVLNMANGVISGTPSILSALSVFTIQASNACGSISHTLSIRVTTPPTSLTYSQASPIIYCTNKPVTPNIPNVLGGIPDTFMVSPSLPSGLALNPTTGQISGTPSLASAATNYTITAANACGQTTTTLNIAVIQTPATPVLTSNSPVSLGTTLQLNASGSSGVVYSWSGPSGFTSTNQNPTIPCASSAQQGSYTSIASFGGCNSAQANLSVTVTGLASISGLSLWLDASSITNVVHNNQISAWQDLSGNNRHATSTNWPTFISNSINGKPVLRFSTAQNILVNHNFPAPYTVFYVAKQTSGARERVLTSNVNNWLLGWWDGAKRQAYYEGWVSSSGTPPADDNVYLYTGLGSGSQSFLYENGNLVFNNSNGLGGPNGLAINAGAFLEVSTCDVAEIIVYNQVLSTTNRVLVENYLKCKWGIP